MSPPFWVFAGIKPNIGTNLVQKIDSEYESPVTREAGESMSLNQRASVLNADMDPDGWHSTNVAPRKSIWVAVMPATRALRHDFFRWFLLGHTISVVGTWMQTAALGWFVQTTTRNSESGSEYWLGVTAAMNSLPVVLFSILAGMMADRWPKRQIILWSQTGSMISAAVFGYLVMELGADLPFWSVLVFAAANGTFLAFDIPARQAFAVEMVGKEDLLSAIAMNSAVFNAGRLLGPAFAGAAIAWVGISWCFFLNAVSFLGVIGTLLMLRPSHEHVPVVAHSGTGGIWQGFRTVLDNRKLLGLMAALALTLITGGAYLALVPALAQNQLGLDATGYTTLMTLNGFGALFGAFLVGRAEGINSRQPTLVYGLATMSIALMALGMANSLGLAGICLFFVGMGFILFLTSTNSTIQLSVADAVRGRVMSIWVLVFGAAQPVGNYFAGHLASAVGTSRTMFVLGSGCMIAAGLVGFQLMRTKVTMPQG